MPAWLVLFPPLLVLIVALISRNVLLSLATGIVSAAALATSFSPVATVELIVCRLYRETDIQKIWCPLGSPDHFYTFVFLITLGIIISFITHSGGIAAYITTLQRRLHTKKATQFVCLLLSMCFFIDDYLSSLVVGSIMRPLTDKFALPRVKLAFLLNAMSAPLCVIIPASSWTAMILVNLQAAGVSEQPGLTTFIKADPFSVYLHTIAYLFYPFFIVASAFFIVARSISFGSMKAQEHEADRTGNLFGGKQPLVVQITQDPAHKGSLIDFFGPIGLFIGLVFALLLYSGNWHMLGGNATFGTALQQANIFFSLCFASVITLSLTLLIAALQKKLTLHNFKNISVSGFMLMKNSLFILLLAWTLSSLLKDDLKAGQYVAHLVLGAIPTFLLPVMIFFTALIIAASIGSAWGTIMIMMPLAVPIITAATGQSLPIDAQSAFLLGPIMGGLLSGAVAGGPVSPIADSTVMSSTSSGAYHLDHIATQFGYVTPAIAGTTLALLIVGLTGSYSPTLSVTGAFIAGLATTLLILYIRNKASN
ncbi:hypothetical protein H0X48_04410 [Candidatus Dependentiae bacterium]|nr:hypothetical protein [Candidatus Dependentiae bacterium]